MCRPRGGFLHHGIGPDRIEQDPSLSAISNHTGTTSYDGNTLPPATSTAGFTDTLTLSKTTTLDFFVDDYYLPDNTGGVSLLISSSTAIPEPASIALTLAGLVVFAMARRKRSHDPIRRV